MRRSDLAHILRAACDVTNDPRILVIGSQAILAGFDEDALPREAMLSIEADIAFFDDPEERKSDLVDGAIGELSPFHDEFGIYGQVSASPRRSSPQVGRSVSPRSTTPRLARARPSASSPTIWSFRSWSPDARRTIGSPGRSSMPV